MTQDKKYKGTILIVDDNPANLGILMEYLLDSGFETLIAQDGEGAINQAEYARPDIILLDIMMPGIDGFETCQKLKENPITKDIPIIFMSALSELENKVRGFSTGGVDYITKPFQQEEVLARINTHLTIERQKKQLYELNATKDKFFSIISHDMRNMFSPMLGSCDIVVRLAQRIENTQLIKYTGNIKQSVFNAHKLMENLLEWARIQGKNVNINKQKIDIGTLAFDIVSIMDENASQKQIKLKSLVPRQTYVLADSNMINTVLRNLTTNALKFTKKNGEIIISSTIIDDYIEVSVSDTGVGISPENIKKLFKIDQKLQKTGTNGEKGTGLGLLLCKDFIKGNGGKIWVESDSGKGSVFKFTLQRYHSQ